MGDEKKCLEAQLREAYGRVTYTYATHLKQADNIISDNKILRYLQIGLSTLAIGGILSTIIIDSSGLTFVAGSCSTIPPGLNLYFKNFDPAEGVKNHQIAADKLWLIREGYVSLLTDLNRLNVEDIMKKGDQLMNETHEAYKDALKTNSKSYESAREALKSKEEQFLTGEELDKMLSEHLRKKSSKY